MPQPTAPSGSPSAATASDPPAPADDGGTSPAPQASEAPAAPAPSMAPAAPAPGPSAAAPADPAPAPTETVVRPEPGLARGVWEAPPWAFWVALGLVVVVAAGYVAARAGLLKRLRPADTEAPKSRRRP